MASQLSSKTITAVYGITQNYIAAFLRLSALAKINTSGQKLAKRREPCLLAACAATRRVAFAPGGAAAAGVKGAARPVVSEPSPAREGRRRSAAILLVDDLRNDVRLLLAQRTRGLQPDLLQAHGTITQLTGGARACRRAAPRTRATVQLGLALFVRTMSPSAQRLNSSCAHILVRRRTSLPTFGSRNKRGTWTTACARESLRPIRQCDHCDRGRYAMQCCGCWRTVLLLATEVTRPTSSPSM